MANKDMYDKRERGYYWVKWIKIWTVMQYLTGGFWLSVGGTRYHEYDLSEINEQQIIPPTN